MTELNKYNIMSNVLIIKTSPRVGGNSDTLADEFARGAAEAGHTVETVSLAGKDVAFCRGCLACQKTRRCVIRDYADEVRQKMHDADVIVWATPVYYYSVSGQMKTMIDRSNRSTTRTISSATSTCLPLPPRTRQPRLKAL